MYARVSHITFHPGTTDEALALFQAVILPSARRQSGFRDVLIARTPDADRGLVITVWDTEAALLASTPPPEIAEALERWDAFIAEAAQAVYAVVTTAITR